MTAVADSVEIGWLGAPRPADRGVPALVVLHGYGANERDLMSMLPVMGMMLPGVTAKVIAIRGFFPVQHRGRRGYSWFPGEVATQPPDADINATADRIADLVAAHTDRAVWLGFSQGMCAAITVMRRRPELFTGLVALSGFSWDARQPADAELANAVANGRGIPAFYGRDPADPAIPRYASAWALEYLRAHTDLQERSYPGVGHSLALPEIADVVTFLRPLLAI